MHRRWAYDNLVTVLLSNFDLLVYALGLVIRLEVHAESLIGSEQASLHIVPDLGPEHDRVEYQFMSHRAQDTRWHIAQHAARNREKSASSP